MRRQRKVVDIEQHIPEVGKKRRRRANKRVLGLLTVAFLIVVGIVYFQTPLSKVARFEVSGAQLLKPEQYVIDSGVIIGDSLWGFRAKDVAKTLEKNEVVNEVTVKRKWDRTVQFYIKEWKAIAYVEKKETFELLLSNGHMLKRPSIDTSRKLPILSNFHKKDKALKKVARQLEQMSPSIYELISEINYYPEEADDKITIYMDDGNEVRALLFDFPEKLKYYPEMIAQLDTDEKGVLDIEVGAFFTPYSQVYGKEEGVDESNASEESFNEQEEEEPFD